MTGAAIILFTIRARRPVNSLLFLGDQKSGKSWLIEKISGKRAMRSGSEQLNSVTHKNNRLIEFAPLDPKQAAKKTKAVGVKHAIYVFDVSPESRAIEGQLKDYKRYKEILGTNFVHVANKIEIADGKKLAHLKKHLGDVHEIRTDGGGIEELKSSIFSLS